MEIEEAFGGIKTQPGPGECGGCFHPLSRHYRDVTGVARCLATDSGYSTAGVIGLPWKYECDCEEFVSPQKLMEIKRHQQEKERQQKFIEERVKAWKPRDK